VNKRTRKWWSVRLKKLYDEARKRRGESLNIYEDVTQLLDYLEELEPAPEGFDLGAACDRLAWKLRDIN